MYLHILFYTTISNINNVLIFFIISIDIAGFYYVGNYNTINFNIVLFITIH